MQTAEKVPSWHWAYLHSRCAALALPERAVGAPPRRLYQLPAAALLLHCATCTAFTFICTGCA